MTYDVIGNICVMKFEEGKKLAEKKKAAQTILTRHKNIQTVVEKVGIVKGRLRTIKAKWLAGEKTLEATYKENGCILEFNIETCYFSPRLSEERKRIAAQCKPGERILVMFGGVAPYAIVIAKTRPLIKKVVSVELGRECNKYAKRNVEKNKVGGKVEIMGGDVKKVLPKMQKSGEIFDRIVMARPNLKETFLKYALMVAKKSTEIHYHGFCHELERENLIRKIEEECMREGRKIKILSVSKAGDIAPGKYRYRVDFKILN
jgi:tRNA (guanine37-N1)-methyltransferase